MTNRDHPPNVRFRGQSGQSSVHLAQLDRALFALTEHTTKAGAPKFVGAGTNQLTGRGCIERVFTDLAVIDVTSGGFRVREMNGGLTLDDLEAKTAAALSLADDCKVLEAPKSLAA